MQPGDRWRAALETYPARVQAAHPVGPAGVGNGALRFGVDTGIVAEFDALMALATAPADTEAELVGQLDTLYRRLFSVDLAHYDLAEARRHAPDLVAKLFAMRLSLGDSIGTWQRDGLMGRAAQRALRDAFRAARYASDMLGELTIDHAHVPEGQGPFPAFTGPHRNTDVNSRFGRLTFRSGDVLLVRGAHHNSAAIARIGDVDSQFSHLAMVHVDVNGNAWVVESLIEVGAIITPLDEHRAHGIGRAILFRHRDEALAAAAADAISDLVAFSLESYRRRILYDFTMELDNNRRRMFCSKLVRTAFEIASRGRVVLPTFPTRLEAKNPDFFSRVGVTAKQTFAPGDMELEPDFDVVAEWRDWRLTSQLRLQDMIMTKLFEWMETRDYVFREDWSIRLISILGRLASHLSDDAKDLIASVVPKVPINMSRRTISVIAMLHKTAEPLLAHLKAIEDLHIDRTGKPLHPRVVLAELEGWRERHGNRVGYLAPGDGGR